MASDPFPGRKSVIYFTWGMYLTPELDVPFRSLMSTANRDNVTFYSVDTRGVMTGAQNAGATGQLNGAARASAHHHDQDFRRGHQGRSDGVGQRRSFGRANVQESIRDLAESTGGFLIGDSNDLRVPAAPRQRRNQQLLRGFLQSRHPESTTAASASSRSMPIARTW